jgi:ribosomal-protein-alanine N-acetyltransferase
VRGQSVMPYFIRPMDWPDLHQVAAMEREAFPTLWPATSYRRELKNKIAEYAVCVRDNEYVEVPAKDSRRSILRLFGRRKPQEREQQQLLTGFVGLWYMSGEAHIVSIAVREDYRRNGLGELLLIGAIEMAQRRSQQVVTLEARVSNTAAIALYEKYQLRQIGIRRGYYSDNHEDAVIMTSDKLTADDFMEHFTAMKEIFEERYGETPRDYL